MFSDVVGYTAMMGRDEQLALRALEAHRDLLRLLLPKFNGRIAGEIGDGTLTSFQSAVDAVNCACAVQATLHDEPDLQVRIGIHLGDVVFANNTVLGDGVNVASRIHALAPPGGICVSANVYDEIRNQPGTRVKDLGEQRLKNVSRPIHVYQIGDSAEAAPAAEPIAPRSARIALLAITGAAAIAAIGIALMRSRSQAPAAPPAPGAASHTISSIAVLPLDNFSGDPNQDYFADGMTDELTTDLATISALRVISRGSVMQFRGDHRPPTPVIARLLNVDAVVEGSVMREGNVVRITAQLIDARADRHLWAHTYEGDARDVLSLQDQIASEIARQVNIELTPTEQAHLADAPAVNPAAHDAYLKGRYFVNRPSDEYVSKAIAAFNQAVKLDPKFAPAYSGLSDAYVWAGLNEGLMTSAQAMPLARATAEKAIELDNNSAEAHTSMAIFKVFYEFDWAGGESEFHRAIALDPNYTFAHDQLGLTLALQGRFDEAWAESARAAELDPLSPAILTDAAQTLMWHGKYQAAIDLTNKSLELDPDFFYPYFGQGWVNIEAGKFSAAITLLQKANALESPSYVAGWLGYAYGASGDRVKAAAMIDEINRKSLHGYVPPFNLALVYLGMGDRERALDGLEKAYAANSQFMAWLKIDHAYDPLRSDPRFIALLKKVHLDQ